MHENIGGAALGHAIELTRDLKRNSGIVSCDVLIAGHEQVLAELNAIGPTAPPSADSLTSLIARIDLFGAFFALLAQLAVVTGSLGTRARNGGEPAEPALAVGNQETGRRMRPGSSIARKTITPSI